VPGQLYEGTLGVPTSVTVANWLAAYETSHLPVLGYVEIWSSLNLGGFMAQTLLGTYKYVSGTVKVDRSNILRRTITDLTLLNDPDNDPSDLLLPVAGGNTGQLSPYGNEVHIFKGTMVSGVATYVPVGVFLIEEVDIINDSNGLVFKGVMNDRMEWLSRLSYSYAWSGGGDGITTVPNLIDQIIANAVTPAWGVFSPFPYAGITTGYPGNYDVPPLTSLAALQHFAIGDDPAKQATDLAAAYGYAFYFDARGAINLEAVPDPYTITPCVAYTEGSTISPVSISRAISNKSVPNVICVESGGTKANPGCTVWWWDSYPSDPAYYAPAPGSWLLPQTILPANVGTYPILIEKFTTNIAQGDSTAAQAMALAIGLTSIGSLEKSTFTLRDQPAHDVDDVVTMQRVVAGIPASTDYVIDQVTIDLSAGGQGVQLVGRLVWTP
jgi:hypothetical protein